MFVYLDETTFGRNNEYSGYASLITESRIEFSVIEEALNNLSADPDVEKDKFKEQDSRTISRGFFHASDDSQNAHSHLCNSINENIFGRFSSLYFETSEQKFRNIEEAYELASKLSILHVFSVSRNITFIFEERNELTRSYIEEWWRSLWEYLLKSQYGMPFIRTYYPKIEFEFGSKMDSGLQVTDFMLWASTRQFLKIQCPWLDRLNSWLNTETQPDSGNWGGHILYFGTKLGDNEYTYGIEDYHKYNRTLDSFEFLTHYIVNAQRVINTVEECGCRDGVSHFWNEIRDVKSTCVTKGNVYHIQALATCFLKLFDNISLIHAEMPEHEKAFWLKCRECLSYSLRTEDIGGKVHAIQLCDIRNQIIENEPDALR